MFRSVALFSLVACNTDPDDKTDKTQPTTTPTTSTTPSTGARWVDAEGVEVPGVLVLPAELGGSEWGLGYDDGEAVWPLDPLGQGSAAFAGGLEVWVVFSDDACTDPWAISVEAVPGVAIRVVAGPTQAGDLAGSAVAVPDAGVVPVVLDPSYELAGANCRPSTYNGSVPLSDLVELDEPATWWTPPLHPEAD